MTPLIEPRQRRSPNWDGALIPLINVIFLLVVFFVLTGRIESPNKFPLDAPLSNIGQPAAGRPVVLTLYKDGRIELDDKSVQREGLYAGLQLVFIADKENPVTIRADAGLPSDYLMSALNLIKRAGGRNITLVTRKPS